MPITTWETRHETSYPSQFKTRYRSLSDAIYDDYDNRDTGSLLTDYQSKSTFEGIAVATEGYISWAVNNLTGGAAPLGGGSFESPYSFRESSFWTSNDTASLLKSMGCRADRNKMCNSWTGKTKTTGVEHTIFGLALCDPGVREQLGNNYEPFEWTAGGGLCLYDRYNFTDLQDFSRAPGGNPIEAGIKALLANVVGQGTGGLIGILNEAGIPDAVNSFFNGVSQNPDYDKSPYFEWRGDGNTFQIQSITRNDGIVTVVTTTPHGMNNTDGAGIKIVDTNTGNGTYNISDNNQGGKPNGVDITITGENSFTYTDPNNGPNGTISNPAGITAVQKKRWGKSRHMYTKDCFSATDLRNHNPELYFDAVGRGKIAYDAIPGVIEVGQKQPNPFVAGIAGLTPYPPINAPITSNTISFGGYGSYPAPFNSWSQQIVNSTYSLGPYAKLNKFVFSLDSGTISVCDDMEDWQGKNQGEYGLYGRLVIIPEGLYSGELGFILQNWYDFDDTPYNTINGQAGATAYDSKAKWFNGASKFKTTAHFLHLSDRPLVEVSVAGERANFGDISYYNGQDLAAENDYTVELLSVIIAAAALSGIIF
jgi:hypothetical protein